MNLFNMNCQNIWKIERGHRLIEGIRDFAHSASYFRGQWWMCVRETKIKTDSLNTKTSENK